MAKKKTQSASSATREKIALTLGGKVKIRNSGGMVARIIELRGPLGPGGAQVYRVRVHHRPKPMDIEVLEDQLTALPADE